MSSGNAQNTFFFSQIYNHEVKLLNLLSILSSFYPKSGNICAILCTRNVHNIVFLLLDSYATFKACFKLWNLKSFLEGGMRCYSCVRPYLLWFNSPSLSEIQNRVLLRCIDVLTRKLAHKNQTCVNIRDSRSNMMCVNFYEGCTYLVRTSEFLPGSVFLFLYSYLFFHFFYLKKTKYQPYI